MIMIYDDGVHIVSVFRHLTPKGSVQTNQMVIVDNGQAALIDPGGRASFNKLIAEINKVVSLSKISYVIYTHQDPDVAGSAASWSVAVPSAKILISQIWTRFIPHIFPPDVATKKQIQPIPDEGTEIQLGKTRLKIIPAHYLHSPGNFSIYDPVSKTLFTGDIGASLIPPEEDYDVVQDFEKHIQYMEWFHRRFMASQKAIHQWLKKISELEIHIIIPQHGAIIQGKNNVQKLLKWLENLKCGTDLI